MSLKRPSFKNENEELNSKNESLKNEIEESEDREKTLSYWAMKILNTPDPNQKADLTDQVAKMWFNNELDEFGSTKPPEQPKRLESLNIIDPAKIRRGKGGTLVKNKKLKCLIIKSMLNNLN